MKIPQPVAARVTHFGPEIQEREDSHLTESELLLRMFVAVRSDFFLTSDRDLPSIVIASYCAGLYIRTRSRTRDSDGVGVADTISDS